MAVNREGEDLIENDISQNHLSAMERGKLEIGTGILLQIDPEFVKKCWMAADGGRVGS